ncbi:MAG TPA: MarC family protein [Solirubrobacterales bacterium]|nr:MarC family protein [Solirubrobacterales bacterium]HNA24483.1 MarC family protein [Solirubrobacterales bacterium]HNA44328.1 MarC family protein [Solirubrobacterales bacterium]HNC93954.1 MarC family protein [Solirubrobacterales bacterium]HNE78847.1 MarC family protein [Solirubrobacterales bacterium]
MEVDLNFYLQSIVAVVVITDPLTRGIFFRQLTANEPERRGEFVRRITIVVAVTLFGAALVGRELLDVMGINLGAFGVAGGLVVALMGFEMLFGGEPSRAQGGEQSREQPESFDGSVVVPYAIPFIAGPGAITTVITIAASAENGEGTIVALVAVAVAVILLPIGHLLVAKHVNLSDQAESVVTKIGGLLITTIGIQLMLSGIQRFFEG